MQPEQAQSQQEEVGAAGNGRKAPLIFLDVDGVLNASSSESFMYATRVSGLSISSPSGKLDHPKSESEAEEDEGRHDDDDYDGHDDYSDDDGDDNDDVDGEDGNHFDDDDYDDHDDYSDDDGDDNDDDVDEEDGNHFDDEVDSHLLDKLQGIVEATGAQVVLSSDWRAQAEARAFILNALEERGIKCVGVTPIARHPSPARPAEILEWLRRYEQGATDTSSGVAESIRESMGTTTEDDDALAECQTKILVGHDCDATNYVILDDRNLCREVLGSKLDPNRFIRTNPLVGLTDQDCSRAVAVLNA